jgi:hypothetical protein
LEPQNVCDKRNDDIAILQAQMTKVLNILSGQQENSQNVNVVNAPPNHRQIHPALTKHKRKVVGPVGNKETLPDHAVVCPLVMPVVSNTGRDACPVN